MNRPFTSFISLSCAAVLLLSACGKPAAPTATAPTDASSAVQMESAGTGSAPETSLSAETSEASSADKAASSESSGSALPEGAAPVSSGVSDQELESAVESQYLSDEDFIANVRYGLEQRWSLVASQDGASLETKDFREYASEAVQAELDGIGELVYYSFKDENLTGLASSYYFALQDQLQGIREAESQEALAQSQVYMRGFCLRTIVLHELKENYGLTVSTDYTANLEQAVSRYEDALQYLGLK